MSRSGQKRKYPHRADVVALHPSDLRIYEYTP
jgi:hypothetical protein